MKLFIACFMAAAVLAVVVSAENKKKGPTSGRWVFHAPGGDECEAEPVFTIEAGQKKQDCHTIHGWGKGTDSIKLGLGKKGRGILWSYAGDHCKGIPFFSDNFDWDRDTCDYFESDVEVTIDGVPVGHFNMEFEEEE